MQPAARGVSRIEEEALESPTQIIYEESRPKLRVRPALLQVVAGPDKGKSYPLGAERVRVGTAAGNHLLLSDRSVSRNHAEFRIQDRGYLLRDLESTNGTFHRGIQVHEALVTVGAELRLGKTTVIRLDPTGDQSDIEGARPSFGNLVGMSEAMRDLYGILTAVSPTDVTVLLEGETGTGKELVAEELHRHSPRRGLPFSVLDCGALPANLIESELFGHEKGAFTGASERRLGVFERSNGGTVFLDEIGELPLDLQTRLLRVLDRRTVKRVGDHVQRTIDIRLVAATNRDLKAEQRAGRFREDLYHRLSVMRVVVPPLRRRREDIPLLARRFLVQLGCGDPDSILTRDLLDVLMSRRWPGNVRELRNVIERALVLVDSGQGLVDSALHRSGPPVGESSDASLRAPSSSSPSALGASEASQADRSPLASAFAEPFWQQPFKSAQEQLLEEFETIYFERLLARHGSNISALARGAGLDRHRVRRLLRKRGLYE
jgi:DNA-binding NtrC family response regulator